MLLTEEISCIFQTNTICIHSSFEIQTKHNCSFLPWPKMENSSNKDKADSDQSPEKEVKNAKDAKTVKMMPFKGKAKNTLLKKMPFKGKAKNMPFKKTTAAQLAASLKVDTLMDGFQSGERERRVKTAVGRKPLKDFAKSAVSLLISDYEVEDEKILSTTALAM